MDPLSDVLSSLKPQSYVARGFGFTGPVAVQFPRHTGIKCYALLSGDCWLIVETVPEPVHLTAGDCLLLPRGLPFCLSTDLSLTPVSYQTVTEGRPAENLPATDDPEYRYMAGGHFALQGEHAAMLLGGLPPIVHLRSEADRAAMRWSLERLREELLAPQPGSSLIAQQIAYMMLVQAIRLHLLTVAGQHAGWLFALADPQMRKALTCVHDSPGHPWTLQSLAEQVGMSRSVFAERFRQSVGMTPMEYVTRWRMLLAGERLRSSSEAVASIAASLGYQSDSAFGKAFRKVMGTSPKQYSRQTNTEPYPTSDHAASSAALA